MYVSSCLSKTFQRSLSTSIHVSSPVCKYLNVSPVAEPSSYISSSAKLIGAVKLGENSSIWYGSTVRADINTINIGSASNIQDNTVIHVSSTSGVNIGNSVTIGHNCVIHACTIGNNCLIGMGSIIMDEAVIGDNCIIASGSIVTKNKKFANNSLILGSPASKSRDLTSAEVNLISESAKKYVIVAREHKQFEQNNSNNTIERKR